MTPSSNINSPQPMTHEQFIRLFLNAERELLRYVMVLVPNVSDARDVVQETAISLWQAIDKYDPTKPFIPWACRFALNEARMHLRKATRQRRYLEEEVAKLLSERRIEIASSMDARREYLRDCLSRLPDDQRQIVRGYYFDEEAIDSLASQLGRGTESIYKSLQRIRQALHQCIERKIKAEY
jgi:RNA polymerase sigma-70 factor, ECF subfamily